MALAAPCCHRSFCTTRLATWVRSNVFHKFRPVVAAPAQRFPGDLSTVALMDVNGDRLTHVIKGFQGSPITAADKHGVFFTTIPLLARGVPLQLNFESLNADAVAQAMPPLAAGNSTFLSTHWGFSLIGYWGNKSGHGVLWQTPVGSDLKYCPVFAEKGQGGWAWKRGMASTNHQFTSGVGEFYCRWHDDDCSQWVCIHLVPICLAV